MYSVYEINSIYFFLSDFELWGLSWIWIKAFFPWQMCFIWQGHRRRWLPNIWVNTVMGLLFYIMFYVATRSLCSL
jgi:hypothetical protein